MFFFDLNFIVDYESLKALTTTVNFEALPSKIESLKTFFMLEIFGRLPVRGSVLIGKIPANKILSHFYVGSGEQKSSRLSRLSTSSFHPSVTCLDFFKKKSDFFTRDVFCPLLIKVLDEVIRLRRPNFSLSQNLRSTIRRMGSEAVLEQRRAGILPDQKAREPLMLSDVAHLASCIPFQDVNRAEDLSMLSLGVHVFSILKRTSK